MGTVWVQYGYKYGYSIWVQLHSNFRAEAPTCPGREPYPRATDPRRPHGRASLLPSPLHPLWPPPLHWALCIAIDVFEAPVAVGFVAQLAGCAYAPDSFASGLPRL